MMVSCMKEMSRETFENIAKNKADGKRTKMIDITTVITIDQEDNHCFV